MSTLDGRRSWQTAIESIASIATLGAAIAIVYGTFARPPQPPPRRVPLPLPAEALSLEGAQLSGNASAPIAILEFSDFQCPYCGQFARMTLPALLAQHVQAGRILFAFRHLPLASVHPLASEAAAAAHCAGEVGKFWDAHDLFFAEGVRLDRALINALPAKVGLGSPRFAHCVGTDGKGQVERDTEAAKALGVRSTPTFFLGRRLADGRLKVTKVLEGAKPVASFNAEVEKLAGQR